LRLFSFGGYGLALAALALVVFGAYDSYPPHLTKPSPIEAARSKFTDGPSPLVLVMAALAEDRHPLAGHVLVSGVRREIEAEGQADGAGLVVHHLVGAPLLDDAVEPGALVAVHQRPGDLVEVQLQRQLQVHRVFVAVLLIVADLVLAWVVRLVGVVAALLLLLVTAVVIVFADERLVLRTQCSALFQEFVLKKGCERSLVS